MANWIDIRVQTEQAKIKYVKSEIEGFAEKAIGPYFFQFMQSMMPEAVDVMQSYIRYQAGKTTKTGKPGRVETGEMWEQVTWRQIPTGKKGFYRFELGWLNGTPGYAIFQEQGTRNGVVAMDSIGFTTMWLRSELKLLGRGTDALKFSNARWRK